MRGTSAEDAEPSGGDAQRSSLPARCPQASERAMLPSPVADLACSSVLCCLLRLLSLCVSTAVPLHGVHDRSSHALLHVDHVAVRHRWRRGDRGRRHRLHALRIGKSAASHIAHREEDVRGLKPSETGRTAHARACCVACDAPSIRHSSIHENVNLSKSLSFDRNSVTVRKEQWEVRRQAEGVPWPVPRKPHAFERARDREE